VTNGFTGFEQDVTESELYDIATCEHPRTLFAG
jgi:hypothetical protein